MQDGSDRVYLQFLFHLGFFFLFAETGRMRWQLFLVALLVVFANKERRRE